jgi:hypothetical protein
MGTGVNPDPSIPVAVLQGIGNEVLQALREGFGIAGNTREFIGNLAI